MDIYSFSRTDIMRPNLSQRLLGSHQKTCVRSSATKPRDTRPISGCLELVYSVGGLAAKYWPNLPGADSAVGLKGVRI